MEVDGIIREMRKHSSEKNREGMARFGIDTKYALGVNVPVMRGMAKKIGKDHAMALKLWKTKIHEARILASMVEEPSKVTESQMDGWAGGFNSWDICDQCCMNLFYCVPFAGRKIRQYSKDEREFVRRTAFAMMASKAMKDKGAKDREFVAYFPLIRKYATDERNFVKKAVNWALRQTGKRNARLNREAIKTAKEIEKMDSKAARWIAKDALRELQSDAVQKRLRK